jgi:hypothetical protein
VLQENILPIGHKDSAFLRHLQIFYPFSFAIEVQREEMRKIIMIKVISIGLRELKEKGEL